MDTAFNTAYNIFRQLVPRKLSLIQLTQLLFGVKYGDKAETYANQFINEFKTVLQPLDMNIGAYIGIIGNPKKQAETIEFVEEIILDKMVYPKIIGQDNAISVRYSSDTENQHRLCFYFERKLHCK